MEYENSLTQTGYVTFYKKISEKVVTISLGVGTKIKEGEYKTGFLNARGSNELLKTMKKGDKVKIKGFLSFNFWTPEGSEKEMQRPVMVVTDVLEVEENNDNGSKKSTSTKKTTVKKTTVKKEEKLPDINIDEDIEEELDENDEIPF